MSYPPPIEGTSADRLYREAVFFYDKYEKAKAELEEVRKHLHYHCKRRCVSVRIMAGELASK